MSTKVQVKTQAKTPDAPAAARIPQPLVVELEREAEQPDIAAQLEGAARLGHSSGAVSVHSSGLSIIQRQDIPEEEEEEELQMKPEPAAIQRQEIPDEEEELQAKPANGVQRQDRGAGFRLDDETAGRINRARGSGRPLDRALQTQMGETLGHDFSGVRVHTDAEADTLNRQLQAKAFTTGPDIFFKRGAYEPARGGGRELIAHELTHVVQQGTGQVLGSSGSTVRPARDAFEQEADAQAHRLSHQTSAGNVGGALPKAGGSKVIQRRAVFPTDTWELNEFDNDQARKSVMQDAVKAADLLARVRAKGALDWVRGGEQKIYGEWFGTGARDKVENVLKQTLEKLERDITYRIDWNEWKTEPGTYAWVDQGKPDEVWLAKQFYVSAENRATTDSTAGTLIHEVSHYAASTEDHVYGQEGCKELAKTSPDKAVENADSYQYYSEAAVA